MDSDEEQGPDELEPHDDDAPTSGNGAPNTTDDTRSAGPPGLLAHTADQAPLPQEVPVPTAPMSLEPEPLEEPGVQASTTASEFPVPPQQQFFRPTKPETFAEQRARCSTTECTSRTAYSLLRGTPGRERESGLCLGRGLSGQTSLPAGWTFEDGFLQLGEVQDECRLQGTS